MTGAKAGSPDSGYPAWAGIDLRATCDTTAPLWLPRVGGDRPSRKPLRRKTKKVTPRGRG